MLAGNVRARSGDLLFRDARPLHGARALRVREIPLPVDASRLALCSPILYGLFILEPFHFPDCPVANTHRVHPA